MYGTLTFAKGDKPASFQSRSYEPQRGKLSRRSACDRCRSSKVRCGSRRPECERCVGLRKSCTFTQLRVRPHTKAEHPASKVVSPSELPQPNSESSEQYFPGEEGQSPAATSETSSKSSPASVSRGDESTDLVMDWWVQSDSSQEFIDLDSGDFRPDSATLFKSDWDVDICLANLNALPSLELDTPCLPSKTYPIPSSPSAIADDNAHINPCLGGPKEDITNEKKEQENAQATDMQDVTFLTSVSAEVPRGCLCLQQLISGLSSLNSCCTSRRVTRASASPLEIDGFLATYKESREKWEGVENCPFSCYLSRDLGLLLLINIEQLANLQLDLIATIKSDAEHVEPDTTAASLAELSFATPTTIHTAPSPTPPSTPSPIAKQTMSIGKFSIDDAMDKEVVALQLLRVRMQDLRLFVERLRPKMMGAGLDDCCMRLDSIKAALGGACA